MSNQSVRDIHQYILLKKHHAERKAIANNLAEKFHTENLSPSRRVAERLRYVLQEETPIILDGENIVLWRTVANLPDIFTEDEWLQIKNKQFIHENGNVCNICPDYIGTIQTGLLFRKQQVEASMQRAIEQADEEGQTFCTSVMQSIDAVIWFSDRYRREAERQGRMDLVNILTQIPRYGARNFHEALQFFRILHFTLWCEGEYHNTIGRFDQYIYPYLETDLRNGSLTQDEAYTLLLEFFLSFNKDSDLYPGVQQGDNGQSMVLGGQDEDGNDVFNLLSELCIKACKELKLIDPKLNLRVHSKTPLEVYELGTELTKEGLGFPQYSNDDIIIPGLVDKGYEIKDARNYALAACWETIIPKYGMDIPNIGALSFPEVVDNCIKDHLIQSPAFDDFLSKVESEIVNECAKLVKMTERLWMIPAPFMSILMDGCIEHARDISLGSKYNNYGIHGTGIATAADSLAAIKKFVFEDGIVTAEEMISAINSNFESHDDLLALLRYESPKMGNDDDYVDKIAVYLLDCFADALEDKTNERAGCFRPGTGSATYYLWHANEIGASADGRKKGEAFGANYSPGLFTKVKGPISVIKSFTKPNLVRTINGGPLTMEFHSTLFRSTESVKKVAMLVKSFVSLGGHQLQLNAVNRERLLDAQRNPEQYSNLIVRVWGWSAYFVELDKDYQDHIINRYEYIS